MLLVHAVSDDDSSKSVLTADSSVEPLGLGNDQNQAAYKKEGEAELPNIASVITQFSSQEETLTRPATVCHVETQETFKVSWKTKFRSIFCCFAPSSNGYYKNADTEYEPTLPRIVPAPPRQYAQAVIGPKRDCDSDKKTLVLDLDETLVHSSFKPIPNPDYIIPVEIDGKLVDVYVLKRPWLDHFLSRIAPRFEVVVFTASLSKYADPLLDLLDKAGWFKWRLFRESCYPYEGNYVKDLNCLGRDLAHTIIVDNSPHSYIFQPFNAVPISTFIDSMEDQELLDILPLLLKVEHVDDVRHYLGAHLHKLKGGQTPNGF